MCFGMRRYFMDPEPDVANGKGTGSRVPAPQDNQTGENARRLFGHFCQNIRFCGNTGNAAMLLGRETGSGTGKADDFTEFLFREIGGLFAGGQEAAHRASAKDIPGTGGVHHADA